MVDEFGGLADETRNQDPPGRELHVAPGFASQRFWSGLNCRHREWNLFDGFANAISVWFSDLRPAFGLMLLGNRLPKFLV